MVVVEDDVVGDLDFLECEIVVVIGFCFDVVVDEGGLCVRIVWCVWRWGYVCVLCS